MPRWRILLIFVTLALAAPATVGATAKNWTHGSAQLNFTREVFPYGTLGFNSDQGGVACPIQTKIDLVPGSTGTLTDLSVSDTSKCTYSGTLDTLCGTVDTHINTGLPGTVHATAYGGGKYGIAMTGLVMEIGGTGVFCPTISISGTLITTMNPHGSMLHLEGTLTSNYTEVVTPFGTWELTPVNTYKIET